MAPGVQYTPPEFRVKKKRLAPRHKREALSFLSEIEQEALPADGGQEHPEGTLSGPAMASALRAPPEGPESASSSSL